MLSPYQFWFFLEMERTAHSLADFPSLGFEQVGCAASENKFLHLSKCSISAAARLVHSMLELLWVALPWAAAGDLDLLSPAAHSPSHPSRGCWPSLALLWHQGSAGIVASQQWGVTSGLTLTPKGQNKCAAFTKPPGPQRAEQKYSPKKGILDFEFFQSCFF